MTEGVQIVWTPWRNRAELLQNRTWLYPASAVHDESGTLDMRRKACDQISAWKLRGKLPHAIESTWLLTESVLADEVPAEHMPIFAVKAAYITAISRFVTGLLDSQQESKYKVSMYAKAQQIGLPALFVDLRHESTHGDMPSLTNLRSAAQRALQWLWEDYWSKLGEETIMRVKESLTGSADRGTGPGVIESIDSMDDKAKEGSRRHGNDASDPIPEAARWSKWQGHWVARPIGTIDTQ